MMSFFFVFGSFGFVITCVIIYVLYQAFFVSRIFCPHCGGQAVEGAHKCCNCGSEMENYELQSRKSSERRRKSISVFKGLIVFIFGSIYLFLLYIFGDKEFFVELAVTSVKWIGILSVLYFTIVHIKNKKQRKIHKEKLELEKYNEWKKQKEDLWKLPKSERNKYNKLNP